MLEDPATPTIVRSWKSDQAEPAGGTPRTSFEQARERMRVNEAELLRRVAEAAEGARAQAVAEVKRLRAQVQMLSMKAPPVAAARAESSQGGGHVIQASNLQELLAGLLASKPVELATDGVEHESFQLQVAGMKTMLGALKAIDTDLAAMEGQHDLINNGPIFKAAADDWEAQFRRSQLEITSIGAAAEADKQELMMRIEALRIRQQNDVTKLETQADQLNQLTVQLQSASTNEQHLRQENASLSRSLLESQQQIDKLKRQLSEAETEFIRMAERVGESVGTAAVIEAESRARSPSIDETQSLLEQLRRLQAENEAFKAAESTVALERSIGQLQAATQIEELRSESALLKAELEEMQFKAGKMKAEEQQLRSMASAWQRECEALQQSKQEVTGLLEETTTTIEAMGSQIEVLCSGQSCSYGWGRLLNRA